jgi:hypothetical protein
MNLQKIIHDAEFEVARAVCKAKDAADLCRAAINDYTVYSEDDDVMARNIDAMEELLLAEKRFNRLAKEIENY